MPKIIHIAAMWSLTQYPSKDTEWSMEQKFAAARDAGFDGVCMRDARPHRKLLDQYGLRFAGLFDSGDRSKIAEEVRAQKEGGSGPVDVQVLDHDTPVAESIDFCIDLLAEGKRQGVDLHVEMHRDTCTETPEKMWAIAEGYRERTGEILPICWDHSHFLVVKHLNPRSFVPRVITDAELIQQARLLHFRPANGHHCQIPVTDGRGALSKEMKEWLPFAETVLRTWMEGPQPGDEYWVVSELGPVTSGYGLSCFPDIWEDAQVLRREIDAAWHRALVAV